MLITNNVCLLVIVWNYDEWFQRKISFKSIPCHVAAKFRILFVLSIFADYQWGSIPSEGAGIFSAMLYFVTAIMS